MINRTKVKVIDKIMGSGKTFDAILNMNSSIENGGNPFLYITPFLDEVKRIKNKVSDVKEPVVSSEIINGEKEVKHKRHSLLSLVSNKENIASTHSLFKTLSTSDYGAFKDYDLILDEVLTPIEIIPITSDDIKVAISDKLIFINDDSSVSFIDTIYQGKFYSELKILCETSSVVYINGSLLVWSFPSEIFKAFKSIKVLTYLFKGSLLKAYFDYYKIGYEYKEGNNENMRTAKDSIKKLLNIYKGKANDIGKSNTAFSKNWLSNKTTKELESIREKGSNLIKRVFKTTSKENAYTTFKDFETKFKGKGYSKGFISVNSRATNDYDNKKTMLYFANRYLNPNVINFYNSRNVRVAEDVWALGELLQWVWRGCIRKGEPMNLYIPSKRMRTLLTDWLNNDDDYSIN